jgi:Na+/melibiose symporter-like transporter
VWCPQGITPTVLALFGIALVTGGLFAWRQLRITNPIFDLRIARVPTFWVAFVGGITAFGALTGSLFIGQQFTQDVLGKSPLEAVLLVLPMALFMVGMVPVTNHLMNTVGSKATLAVGLVVASMGFVVVVFTWVPGASIGWVLLSYALLGIGIGLASAPASRALTASVPVAKVGMGSAATDLTKDLGGAVFQALLGALLTFVYADYFTRAYDNLPPAQAQELSSQAVIEVGSSYAGAQRVAENAPAGDGSKLIAAANHAFTDGKTAAIMVALATTLLGAVVVWLFYPSRQREAEIFAKAQAGQHPGT